MAIPQAAVETYDQVGRVEDLSNAIYDVSPTETPAMSRTKRSKATNTLHRWQTDELAAAATPWDEGATAGDDANAAIEGDDAPDPTFIATTKIGNYTQIMTKTVIVTGTADAVETAGRRQERGYQIRKKIKEFKRDIERAYCGNQSADAGGGEIGTPEPRRFGSLEAWIETNTDHNGTDGGISSGIPVARTDGSQRALSEAMFKNAIQLAWAQGGQPSTALVGPKQKQNISAFTGHSTRTDKSEDKRVVASVDVYVHDFGTISMVASRLSRDRTCLILDWSLLSLAYLRSFRSWPLARTGDAEKKQMLAEFTVKCNNEKGLAAVCDLTTT